MRALSEKASGRVPPRHPMVILGGLRENVEHLQQRVTPASSALDRISALLTELEWALVQDQLEASVALKKGGLR